MLVQHNMQVASLVLPLIRHIHSIKAQQLNIKVLMIRAILFSSHNSCHALLGVKTSRAQFGAVKFHQFNRDKLEGTHSNLKLQPFEVTRNQPESRQDVLLASRNSGARGCPKEEGGEARIHLGVRQVEPSAHGESLKCPLISRSSCNTQPTHPQHIFFRS